MKKLVRIKLINWHLFSNQTVEINQNALLSGENGAGKSTFLDALQYVLTGGKAKFNTAANTNAKRDLEGYVRCKLGTENKTYLRSEEVTSHIALEFFDDQNSFSTIIGVIIEINKNGRMVEKFYVITHQSIKDELYIEGEVIRGYSDFKRYLSSNTIHVTFADTKEQTRKLFLNALDIKNYKYIELIPKALAFRPIDELNKFVFDFLLNDKKVCIDDLRQNVRSYREFENLIKTLREKIAILTSIEMNYEEYKKVQYEIDLYSIIIRFIQYEELLNQKNNLETSLSGLSEQVDTNHLKQSQLEESIIQLYKQIDDLHQALNDHESYRYLNELEAKLKTTEVKLNQTSKQFQDFKTILHNEIQLCHYVYHHLKQEDLLKPFINIKIDAIQPNEFKMLIKQIKSVYETIKDDSFYRLIELKKQNETLDEELKEINDQVNRLEKNQFHFDHQVTRLKTLIDEELTKLSGTDYSTKVLCELIDVKDEVWRNALEGYLNSQRFDLIIEPEYFDVALKVYEKHKLKEKLHGVGLVNTNEIEKYQETVEQSLAAKVTSTNRYARCYCNMLLNRVICVEDVSELKKHKTSITPTCMVYNNYTARQIREEVYRQPFIGMMAVQMQKEHAKLRKSHIEEKRIDRVKQVNQIEFNLQRVKSHQLDYIHHHCHLIDEYDKLEKTFFNLTEQVEKYKVDCSYLNLQTELEDQKNKLKELEATKKQLLLEEGKLQSEWERKKTTMNELDHELINTKTKKEELVNLYISLLGNVEERTRQLLNSYNNDYQKTLKTCLDKIKQNEELKNKIQSQIQSIMNQYNSTYHFGAEASLDGIKAYFDELSKIKQYELLKYEDQARESRLICEIAFKEQFIFKLRENILLAHEELNNLNKALVGKKFGGDEYEFIYKPSSNHNYSNYYKLIISDEDYFTNTLFTESVSDQNKLIMKELFDKLVIDTNDEEAEKSLQAFTDYRNYMSYDIRIHHKNGESTLFSKVSREKSGGETQTPFYVVIAASFEQLIVDKLRRTSPACFVMFDEAFNNMDESRIQAMMEFYRNLNIQLMIAVPPQRIETILEHVNTTLIVIKDDEQSYIESFNIMAGLNKSA